MQLTVRDVSKLLNVSERTIYRWIQDHAIPAYKIFDQYRFNKAELLEWVNNRRLKISSEIFQESDANNTPLPSLYDALKTGGIHYRIEGSNKESVLQCIVDLLNLPEKIDREFLLRVLLAREELASTAIGDGIAIPHVRNPIVLNVQRSILALCFLEKNIDFGALDGKPIYCLFTLISPTARAHLHLLSKLAFALQDVKFKAIIQKHGSRDEILNEIQRFETSVKHHHSVNLKK